MEREDPLFESSHLETPRLARVAECCRNITRGAPAAEVVNVQLGSSFLARAEGPAVADCHLHTLSDGQHGVEADLVARGAPGVVRVGQAGVVEAGRGVEDCGAVTDVEAVCFEDAHYVDQADGVGTVGAGELHVLEAFGERHTFEYGEDFLCVVGFSNEEEGGVEEDELAFGDGAGGKYPLAFSGGYFDGVRAV